MIRWPPLQLRLAKAVMAVVSIETYLFCYRLNRYAIAADTLAGSTLPLRYSLQRALADLYHAYASIHSYAVAPFTVCGGFRLNPHNSIELLCAVYGP